MDQPWIRRGSADRCIYLKILKFYQINKKNEIKHGKAHRHIYLKMLKLHQTNKNMGLCMETLIGVFI